MKICFVLEHFHPHVGGAEVLFSELVKRLVKDGNQIRVVTSDSGGITGESDYFGATVFHYKTISFFGHPILNRKHVEKHIQWSDLVHTATYTAAPVAYKLSKKFGKTCIITVYEALGEKWFLIEKNPLKSIAYWIFEWFVVVRRFNAWHAISFATKSGLEKYGVNKKKIHVIYPGIDESVWNPDVKKISIQQYFNISPESQVFLYTGRPGKPKGIFVLLQAIRKLHSTIDTSIVFGFILSNDPISERKKFEKLVNKYNLNDRIKTLNSVPYTELPGLKKAAYANIIPSLTEGFGFSAIESMYLDVPVIASTAGSLPEVLGGKVKFFLNNNSDDLANAILKALNREYENKKRKSFEWDIAINKLKMLYKEYANS